MNAPINPKVAVSALCSALLSAKAAEEKAKANRIDIENQIIALVEVKPEGATTYDIDDDTKLTVTGNLTRKADIDSISKLAMPADLLPIKTKRELDEVGFKWLKANRPELYALVAEHVTTTPAKTTVTVKRLPAH